MQTTGLHADNKDQKTKDRQTIRQTERKKERNFLKKERKE